MVASWSSTKLPFLLKYLQQPFKMIFLVLYFTTVEWNVKLNSPLIHTSRWSFVMEEDPYQIYPLLRIIKESTKKFVWPVIEVKKSVMDGPCLQIGESKVFIQLQ